MAIRARLNKTLLSLALLASPALYAADQNDKFAVKGAGISPCSTFIKAMENKDHTYYMFGGWLDGYITSLNQQLPDTFDITPWQTTELLMKIIESNCQQNPNQQIHSIAKAMVVQLMEQRITVGERYLQLEADKNLILQEGVIRNIKQKLDDKGHYDGDLTVSWDEKEITAMKAFQRTQQLEETGLPNQATLYKLFYGQDD